ncbi:MAG: glucose-1-phosphate adenylyltransferase [Corallococcus sp.]|nr:glucose-1-phosphate adenylyltransferase [Corallococcus sp.]
MRNKECIAMILAGGQGSRLGVLTRSIAKPAVQFGGKYRIIDFPLTNCTQSGIDTVGVLTQYKPLELNTYIGSGQPWDLDRNNGGVFLLPPYMKEKQGEWYKGTANAIYQNIEFIDKFDPQYVLILSGDHIYKMDYSAMLDFHKKSNAEVTIAMIPVDISEASRFGILETDRTGKIVTFEEKPKNPRSNTASMGIYVFDWKVLREELIADEDDPSSDNDFGKNVIPKMLGAHRRMYGYRFEGYWKDVGTVESLWQSNMDLLDDDSIDLYNEDWPILSKSPLESPHFLDKHSCIKNSFITEGCYIDGTVNHSVIFDGVKIEQGAQLDNCIVMSGARIMSGAKLSKTIVAPNAQIGRNATVGLTDSDKYLSNYCTGGVTLIGPDVSVCDGAEIGRNNMVTENVGGKANA